MFLSMHSVIHLLLHVTIPLGVARWFYPGQFFKAAGVMLATMLVDLDHLWANPIFDPNRCSIGYHPLHSEAAIIFYLIMFFSKKLRWIALGLIIHMFLDGIDCLFMN